MALPPPPSERKPITASQILIVIAIVVLTVVGGAMWFLQMQPPAKKSTSVSTPAATPAPAQPLDLNPSSSGPVTTATPAPKPRPPRPADARPLEQWEMQIENIIASGAGEAETAQMLINLLPSLPKDGQEEAAQHISNLVLDEHYSRVMPLIRNTNLPEGVHDTLVTDLMNRADSVKLPTLLEIAKIPNHPYHDEALTDLQIFLDEDFGTDWPGWDAAMKQYLKTQADEEAAADGGAPASPGMAPVP